MPDATESIPVPATKGLLTGSGFGSSDITEAGACRAPAFSE
jgi:hypothetical protein